VYDHLLPGGAFVIVEKILGDTAQLDEMMVATYYNFKRGSGYTEEEIWRKRMALRGVLVPLTAEFNKDLLRRVGFRDVDCFWRWMNFAGWVAVKSTTPG
jgi:tRNA (cmo5U34)-methyltransferase